MRWPGVVAIGAVVGAVMSAVAVLAVPAPSAPVGPTGPVVVAAGDQGALVEAEDKRLSHLIGDALAHPGAVLANASGEDERIQAMQGGGTFQVLVSGMPQTNGRQ